MKNNIKIECYQQDWIPGFAAFADNGQLEKEGTAHIMLNLGSLLCLIKNKEIKPSEMPYIVAECLMHEIFHVLESWAEVEFSEEKIEKLIEKYQFFYFKNGGKIDE